MIRARLRERGPERVLDFDLEALAAGYADPSWVPDKVTAAAWSWVGESVVYRQVDPYGFFDRERRRTILYHLLEAISEADVVQGHNIVRYDLRVLNAECMRLGLAMPEVRYVDTIQLPKSKGFKKGQDDIATLLDVPIPKKTLGWQQWDDAYEEGPPWRTVEERVVSDVEAHKIMTERMREKGWLKPPKLWRP